MPINKEKLALRDEVAQSRPKAKRYESWRIGILEEVAKLKLKNKVDNIDKAGLSDILNGWYRNRNS